MDNKDDIETKKLIAKWKDDEDLLAAEENLKKEVVLMVELGRVSKAGLNAIHDFYIKRFKCMILGHPNHNSKGSILKRNE